MDEEFQKIEVSKLIDAYKKTNKKSKSQKPCDLGDVSGKVYVVLRKIPYTTFTNKIKFLNKLKQIVGTISPQHIISEAGLMEESPESIKRKKMKAEKIKNFLMSVNENKLPDKKTEVKEGKGEFKIEKFEDKGEEGEEKEISMEEVEKESQQPTQQPLLKEEREEKPGELLKKEEVSLNPVVNELIKDSISEEYNNLIIEDKETYSKVKEGVGISYIDNHKPQKLSMPCKELNLNERAEEVTNEIFEAFSSSNSVSKAELSKRLVELTRLFLKAKSRDERDKIKEEIVEVKHALKTRGSKRKIDPLLMLKERQESHISSILSKIETNFYEVLNSIKNNYEEALSLNPSGNLREKINSLREEDLLSLKSEISSIIPECLEKIVKLHKLEYELIAKKAKIKKEKIEEHIKRIEEYNSIFEELKNKLISKIDEELKKKEAMDKTKEGEKQNPEKEEKVQSENDQDNFEMIKKDLESLGDANWLHYLGKENRRIFWKYVRGEMNKKEAIKKAKELYIKEKAKILNLNNEEVSKLLELI